MTSRILFVCLGNICRSPAAEGVVRSLKPDVSVDSAGTARWHVGKPPYGPMQIAAKLRGYDLSDLRARQITGADFERFDLLVGMDEDNRAQIETLRPEGSTTPVKLLTEYAPDSGMNHVPDPYFTRDFDAALDLIERAAKGLVAAL